MYWTGMEGEYNVMATDYLGPSLEDLFAYCDKKFSLKTTLIIADQVVYFIFTYSIVSKTISNALKESVA